VTVEVINNLSALLDIAQGFPVLVDFPEYEESCEIGLKGKLGLYAAMVPVRAR
jgi:hypothetical protein